MGHVPRVAPGGGEFNDSQPWMSLRDYFAAAALTGMYLSEEVARWNIRQSGDPWQPRTTDTEFARAAYQQADAMLAERARRSQP
jgi:hypothetical protein